MAVARLYLIGKKLEKFFLDIVHYHTFYVHTNIFSVFNEPFQSFPYIVILVNFNFAYENK